MKTQILRFCLVVSCLFAYVFPVKALEWWEKVEYLTYSPRYFGPNAFPIPELVGGSLSSRWEVELRGEYHKTQGDQTKDIFCLIALRLMIFPPKLHFPTAGQASSYQLGNRKGIWSEITGRVSQILYLFPPF